MCIRDSPPFLSVESAHSGFLNALTHAYSTTEVMLGWSGVGGGGGGGELDAVWMQKLCSCCSEPLRHSLFKSWNASDCTSLHASCTATNDAVLVITCFDHSIKIDVSNHIQTGRDMRVT